MGLGVLQKLPSHIIPDKVDNEFPDRRLPTNSRTTSSSGINPREKALKKSDISNMRTTESSVLGCSR